MATMNERCAACGKPITLVRASSHFLTLQKTWVHVSKRANRSHYAIPESALKGGDDDE
jgi:hypothetical protein